MGNYTLTQGLAEKLFVPPAPTAVPAKDTVFVQGDGWLDVARSDSLWRNVFKGPQSVLNSGEWVDRPSVGIPYLYVATGVELAEALKGQGNLVESLRVFDMARRIAKVVKLEDLLRPAEAEFGPAAGDTSRQPLIPVPAPAPAKTDSTNTPGSKPAPKP
jgi:hypothetical protein